VEQRLDFHAGADRKMMRRLVSALAVVAISASPVVAAPKKKPALAEFNKGVEAFQKGDLATASEAFGKSFSLEADVETLFAWAQVEKKLDHCEKANELFEKLLTMKLPEENKAVVRGAIDECKAAIAAKQPPPVETKPDPKPDSKPDPEPVVDTKPEAQPEIRPNPDRAPSDEGSSPAWWKNPVGGALVGLGLVGVGVGTVFFIQGKNLDADKDKATSYTDYESKADDAESKGRIGVIGLAAGGALIVGGVIWYATHSGGKKKESTVSGWVAPDSGGFAVSGRF